MSKESDNDNSLILPLLVALANMALFGGMFVLMHYYELIGADTAYFDEGSVNNLKMINGLLEPLGMIKVDPFANPEITTRGYAVCYGIFLVSTFFSFVLANRKTRTDLELTDAKV